jgi:hypothetical protein
VSRIYSPKLVQVVTGRTQAIVRGQPIGIAALCLLIGGSAGAEDPLQPSHLGLEGRHTLRFARMRKRIDDQAAKTTNHPLAAPRKELLT